MGEVTYVLTICGGPVCKTGSPAAQSRAPCSICKTYVQKVEETWALTTEVEHPRVFIDTYSSAYWQLPLRMYRHIRRLYDPPVHTAIYWIEMYMMRENGAAAKSGLLKKTRRLHENRDPGTVFTLPHFACSMSDSPEHRTR